MYGWLKLKFYFERIQTGAAPHLDEWGPNCWMKGGQIELKFIPSHRLCYAPPSESQASLFSKAGLPHSSMLAAPASV